MWFLNSHACGHEPRNADSGMIYKVSDKPTIHHVWPAKSETEGWYQPSSSAPLHAESRHFRVCVQEGVALAHPYSVRNLHVNSG